MKSTPVAIILTVSIVSTLSLEPPQQRIFFPIGEQLPEPACRAYDGREGTCRIISKCSTFFQEIAELSRSPCEITQNQQGVCCPLDKGPTRDPSETLHVVDPQSVPVLFPDVTVEDLNVACESGLQNQTVRENFQIHLANNHIEVARDSPAFLHARLFQTSPDIIKKSKDANVVLETSKVLSAAFHLNDDQKKMGLPQIDFKQTIIRDKCPPKPPCPEPTFRYRTFDGTCNNIQHETWGSRGVPFKRMLPPAYQDGLSTIRTSFGSGTQLPSARLVSKSVSPPEAAVYANLTIIIWQWGQFLDHDITHTPISKGANGLDVSCCLQGDLRPSDTMDPECFPIEINPGDSFYAKFGQRCMEFVRSMAAVKTECSLGHREQMNQITSFIDASNVYGSSEADASKLRAFNGGLLKVQTGNLLPKNKNDGSCRSTSKNDCFSAGDSRVNEQVDLAIMHTIWVRQHNQIVKELARLNPGWDDDILYHEGRRLVGAQMQHITYNEYLPIVLGRDFMESYGLLPKRSGYYRGYNKQANPTISNAFATAAFRYGHTLITDKIQGFSRFGRLQDNMDLSDVAFVPSPLYNPDTFDNLVRGLVLQQSQKFDRFFTEQLTNKLFSGANGKFGMDLVALNIQRGRDHGLESYANWRSLCEMPPANSWNDLHQHMEPDVVAQLQNVYNSVNDIDLFIGGVAERPVQGTLVGPTFLCILGRQFIALKIGDRFFYENGDPRQETVGVSPEPLASFTLSQLDEIRKTTLARILCDNANNVEMMQPLAFTSGVLSNKRIWCENRNEIPRMSLDPWMNSRVWNK